MGFLFCEMEPDLLPGPEREEDEAAEAIIWVERGSGYHRSIPCALHASLLLSCGFNAYLDIALSRPGPGSIKRPVLVRRPQLSTDIFGLSKSKVQFFFDWPHFYQIN